MTFIWSYRSVLMFQKVLHRDRTKLWSSSHKANCSYQLLYFSFLSSQLERVLDSWEVCDYDLLKNYINIISEFGFLYIFSNKNYPWNAFRVCDMSIVHENLSNSSPFSTLDNSCTLLTCQEEF